MRTEPVMFLQALAVLLIAIVTFGVNGLGLQLTADEQNLVKVIVDSVILLIIGFVQRSRVTPT